MPDIALSKNEMAEMIPPSGWVERHIGHIPPAGRVLDLACGRGRHARLLAARNFQVFAVDRDMAALLSMADTAGIETACLDLEGEAWPLAGQSFAGIVVTNYLWRPRLADLLALLAPGGVLVYETFMLGNAFYGKPARPEFLLQPGELRQVVAAAGWREIAFEEGYAELPKPCMRQAIVAERPI